MTTAIFDVDHTIVPTHTGTSFLRVACKRGALSPSKCLQLGGVGVLHRARLVKDARATRLVHDLLAGANYDRLASLAREFVAEAIIPRLYSEARTIIERHLSSGDRVVLASGSPDFVIQPIAETLGIAQVIAASYEIREGRIVKVRSPVPFENGKRDLLLERGLLSGSPIHVYSDDEADLPLFRHASFAGLVNPHPTLIDAMRREEIPFEIFHWRP